MTDTLFTKFRNTALRHPGEIALEVGGIRVSYAELSDLAERLGAALTATTDLPVRAVGLCASRSLAAYAGYLAALRVGATVVPLGVAAPAARNVEICRLAGIDVVIVDDAGAALRDSLPVASLYLADDAQWWRDDPAAKRPLAPYGGDGDDVAYVLFTSGSTGKPKGVPVRHRQLAEYLPYCVERYSVGVGSRLSQTFDLTFDPSVFDMFVAWSGGATVVVPERAEVLTPVRLVNDRRITHWFSVPSIISLARRLRGLRPESMPGLRWSLFAGEQLSLDQAAAWAAAAPNGVVENLYGPTELTVTCTGYRLPARSQDWPATSNGTVPIGRPLPYLEAMVLAEPGGSPEEGELCMRGSQRFDGYLDPLDNAGRFCSAETRIELASDQALSAGDWYRTGDRVRWHDGELVHLGRRDGQVKIDGHRVELGEIEHKLRRHPAVDDAVVLGMQAGGGRVQLHAVYSGPPDARAAILEHLRRQLPAYMVPDRVLSVPQLPTNGNGKIDRGRVRTLALGAVRPARGWEEGVE